MDRATQERLWTASEGSNGCAVAAQGTPTTQQRRCRRTTEDASASAVALVAIRMQPLQGIGEFGL
jgi:hypothetical protein